MTTQGQDGNEKFKADGCCQIRFTETEDRNRRQKQKTETKEVQIQSKFN